MVEGRPKCILNVVVREKKEFKRSGLELRAERFRLAKKI